MMHRLIGIGAALLFVLLSAGAARSAPLPITGQLTIGLGSFPQIVLPSRLTPVSAADGSFVLPSNMFATTTAVVPVTSPTPAIQWSVSGANKSAVFSAGRGRPGHGFGGRMSWSGFAAIGFIGPPPPLFTVDFPLQLLGIGGTFTPMPISFPLNSTTGYWTTGSVSRVFQVGTATSTTLALQGFDARTPGRAGALRLVTPITIINVPGLPQYPLYATMDLNFLPEPGVPVLLSLGAAASFAAGRRRSR